MIRLFYAEKDTTLYEKYPEQNTGIDQILELTKIASGSKLRGIIQGNTYNSRFLIDFGSEITKIQTAVTNGEIPAFDFNHPASASAYLRLYAANATDLLQSYDINAYPISESWTNGGGNYSDSPIQKYGASWYYRTSDDAADYWLTGSADSVGQMGATETTEGGGTWLTGSSNLYEATQSFQNESPDLRINVTRIISASVAEMIPNHGFIVKRPTADEISGEVLGKLQFFGRESHTIYVPRLEVCWDDINNAGGTDTITADTYVPYIKNIKNEYRTNEIAKFRIGVRPDYPTKTYSTASFYMTKERLPRSSSYSIYDSVTNDVIIQDETEWSNSTTKISNDSDGSYFKLRMDSFMPERYYKIQLKCVRTNDTQTFDDFYFKVVK
tara:strand:- start:9902 stop:11053 length:1152 start_codon:yes stop_codon:yes gene_type:complete